MYIKNCASLFREIFTYLIFQKNLFIYLFVGAAAAAAAAAAVALLSNRFAEL